MKKDKLKIKVKVDTSEIDRAIKKVDELSIKLQIKELKDEIDKLKKRDRRHQSQLSHTGKTYRAIRKISEASSVARQISI